MDGVVGGVSVEAVVVTLYYLSPVVALLALIAGVLLGGRGTRITATLSGLAAGFILTNEVVALLTDGYEREQQPSWYVLLTLGWGLATLALLAWSFAHPPMRALRRVHAGDVARSGRAEWRRRLAVMYLGLVLSAGFTFAAPTLYMLYASSG